DADILVIESTYGRPDYVFPEQEEIEDKIIDWVEDSDQPLFLFAYSLGKAQRIQYLIEKAGKDRLYVHENIYNINEIYEKYLDFEFSAEKFRPDDFKEGVVVLPSNLSRSEKINDLIRRTDGIKAGFSGWAIKDSYEYRNDLDVSFPFSDHCDFQDLIKIVENVNPEKIYTFHGFSDRFAGILRKKYGYNAVTLSGKQKNLEHFN
ncbi:MAG: MBL fold metallo-hydrolase RNA specificity domain-containing protein, partial [Candidatus Nanohaloarchaea archaeon]